MIHLTIAIDYEEPDATAVALQTGQALEMLDHLDAKVTQIGDSAAVIEVKADSVADIASVLAENLASE